MSLDIEEVSADFPIRQGDLLKEPSNSGNKYWVVVSADCDLAQGKLLESGVACVPLVSLRAFFLDDYGLLAARRQLTRRQEELSTWINGKWQQISDRNRPITYSNVIAWIHSASCAEISEALQISGDAKASAFLMNEVSTIKSAEESLDVAHDCVGAFVALQRKSTSRAEMIRSQFGKLDSYQLPLDLFFVSRVPGESAFGFVAKLRNLSFVSSARLFTSVSLARDFEDAYLRIARLTPTYKHGLAQQLSLLFSRIGFPSPYERERDIAFALTIEDLAEELGEWRA